MTKYFLLTGQSNARGKGTGGDFTISPLVKVWNNKNEVSDLTNLGNAWVTPDRNADPFVSGWNNLGVHAANQIALATGEEVRLVIVAKGGIPIGQWYASSARQPMLNRIVAVLRAAGVTTLDGFWWHQGESDDTTTTATYLGRFQAMLRELGPLEAGDSVPNEQFITPTTAIVVGECTGGTHGPINTTLAAVQAADPDRTALAPIAWFKDIGDGSHFTGPELVRIGLIYGALTMLKLA